MADIQIVISYKQNFLSDLLGNRSQRIKFSTIFAHVSTVISSQARVKAVQAIYGDGERSVEKADFNAALSKAVF
ncbi:hypothetical protein KIN20_032457 [Parelaphostrongylus tenuis]|uniref:Uncharacterized protein n=1 Tax=Parelaphostrongylus tenuis TaxID=148309 RepID=A0AAD5WI17_PARTN|nr:hypothetical protein KIN20_032457 [Parelaphostrongylus tenuis]